MIPRKEIIEPVGKLKDVSQRRKQWMLRCGRVAMFPFRMITITTPTSTMGSPLPLLTLSTFMLSPFTRLLFMSILLTTILRSFSTLTFLFSGLPLTSSVGLPGTLSP